MKKILIFFFFSAWVFMVDAQTFPTAWELIGNANTSRCFLGTTDANPLIFKTSNTERMRLAHNGSFLGIGISDPDATLHLHYQNDGQLSLLTKNYYN